MKYMLFRILPHQTLTETTQDNPKAQHSVAFGEPGYQANAAKEAYEWH